MGAATKGGGAVEKGPRNKMLSKTSQTSGPIMMAEGGAVGRMARGIAGEYAGGVKKVMEDVNRIVGTESGKRKDREVEAKAREGINLEKEFDKKRQREEASRYAKGGAVNQHKRMAMGEAPVKMMGGGMMKKGYAAGGMVKKGYAAGGAVKKKMMASGGKGR